MQTKRPADSLKKLPDSLKKHIYRFLVESNLDLINPYYRNKFLLGSANYYHSTLAIIRQINNDSKRITQDWQDKFKTFLNPHLDADAHFKKFYTSFMEFTNSRSEFLVDSLLNPIFDRMQGSIDERIVMLKSVLDECNNWKEHSNFAESKNVIEKTKYELREIYISLNQMQESDVYDRDFKGRYFQYKYLIIEKIIELLFKQNYNYPEKRLEEKLFFERSILEYKKDSHVGSYQAARNCEYNTIKFLFLCCIFPLTLTAITGGLLMKDGQGRDALLGTAISFSILAACISFFIRCCCIDGNEIMQQRFLNFRTQVFNDIDSRYKASSDTEHKTNETKNTNDLHIDIKDEKDDSSLSIKQLK